MSVGYELCLSRNSNSATPIVTFRLFIFGIGVSTINGERVRGILIPSCFQKLKYEFLKAYLVLYPVKQPLMRLADNETQALETKCTKACWTNYTRRVAPW